MAQAHARGDTAAVGRGFAQALCATTAVSAGLVLLLTAAPEQVLALFATNKEMMRDARTYLEIR
jgi:Na+-driven multidrug efflux pump